MKEFQGQGDIYFLKEMYDEVEDFWKELSKTEEGKKYLKRAKNNRDKTLYWNNEIGTALSYFFCAKENNILTVMCDNIISQGFQIGAYCYDGMMVYKKNGEVDLKRIENYVYEVLGYEIKLDYKEMNEGITQELIDSLPNNDDNKEINLDDLEIECDFFSNDKYYIDFLNEYNNKVYNSLKNMIIDVIPEVSKYIAHYEVGSGLWIIKTNENEKFKLCEKAGELTIFVGDTKYNLFGIPHPKLNIYKIFKNLFPNFNRIVCKPNHYDVGPNDFNTWNGFRVKPSDSCNLDLIEPFLYHIREIWSSGDLILYKYILSWFSRIVKEPWNRTGVVLVVYGSEGCGKNIITEFFSRKVFGSECAIEGQGVDELINKFNNRLVSKVLYVANEIPLVKDDFNTTFEKLKNVITGSTLRIEQKGKDSYDIDNLLNIIATTNNSYSFKISKNDRRYLPFEVNDSKRGNFQYFKDLYDSLNNDEVASNVMKYLLDYEGMPLHPIPMTALKEEMSDRSLNSLERFFQYLKNEIQENPETAFLGEQGFYEKRLYSYNELWSTYISWCSETHESPFKQSYFKTKISKILGPCIRKRRKDERNRDKKYTCYVLDFEREDVNKDS
jgi:hypothetical protein